MARLVAMGAAAVVVLGASPAFAGHQPIVEGPDANQLPAFMGSAATPNPVFAPDPPRHPFMAPNGRNNIHNDAYMTDTYQGCGPAGRRGSRGPARRCSARRMRDRITFDSQGRLVTVCVGLDRAVLRPHARHSNPGRAGDTSRCRSATRPRRGFPFNDFTGGGYFYLDHLDRAVLPTSERHVYVVAQTAGDRVSPWPGITT